MNIAAQHPGLLAHKTALEHSVVAEKGGLGVLPFACHKPHDGVFNMGPLFQTCWFFTHSKQSPHIAHIICFSLMGSFSVGLIIPQALCCKVEIWHSAPSNFSYNEPLTSFMTTIGTILTKYGFLKEALISCESLEQQKRPTYNCTSPKSATKKWVKRLCLTWSSPHG